MKKDEILKALKEIKDTYPIRCCGLSSDNGTGLLACQIHEQIVNEILRNEKMCETTEFENLKKRLCYLESFIEKMNNYLASGRSIHPESEAHQELNKLRVTCDYQQWTNWGEKIS